jgi:hypothetical protein
MVQSRLQAALRPQVVQTGLQAALRPQVVQTGLQAALRPQIVQTMKMLPSPSRSMAVLQSSQ